MIGIPEPTVLVIIFRFFIWPLSFINAGKRIDIYMLRFEILFETKGQDHVIREMITMKLLRLLLMMKRHPNIRKVFDEIKFQVQ